MDQNLLITIISISGTIFLALLILLIIVLRYHGKKDKVIDQKVEIKEDDNEWKEALGGNDNIKSVEVKGSRLIVYIENNSLVEKEKLHDLGASSIILSEDKVTVVLKNKVENIGNLLK